MSLSASLSNALSGLGAASRAAQIVSSNIANAMTEGYAPRALTLSARATGDVGGVAVGEVRRNLDPVLLADRRLADAAQGEAGAEAEALQRLERLIGLPGEAGSLSQRLAGFESALLDAAAQPGSPQRLEGAVAAARDLAGTFARVSDGIDRARGDADRKIDQQVARLKGALRRVEMLNGKIVAATARGHDASALLDQRQAQIDTVAALVPLREVARAGGAVALFTARGAVLLDGKAVEVGFQPAPLVQTGMTQGSGLSALSLDGTPVATDAGGTLAGGSLAAQFALRDDILVAAQADLDALARDLVARFQSLDGSGPGGTGLFTDAGGPFDPLRQAGLAGRLALNPAADPAEGGAARLLRDGLDGADSGTPGDGARLAAAAQVLTRRQSPADLRLGLAAQSLHEMAALVLSRAASGRLAAEERLSFETAQREHLRAAELAGGVDSDAEMQRLLEIEQAYAANARVIATVDEMMNALLRI